MTYIDFPACINKWTHSICMHRHTYIHRDITLMDLNSSQQDLKVCKTSLGVKFTKTGRKSTNT